MCINHAVILFFKNITQQLTAKNDVNLKQCTPLAAYHTANYETQQLAYYHCQCLCVNNLHQNLCNAFNL